MHIYFFLVYVSNLDAACLRCICTASTGCDENYECSPQGFCGPFFVSRKYWEEADRVTLNSDSRFREDGHEECAKNYSCASKIVANYMAKNGRVSIFFFLSLNNLVLLSSFFLVPNKRIVTETESQTVTTLPGFIFTGKPDATTPSKTLLITTDI